MADSQEVIEDTMANIVVCQHLGRKWRGCEFRISPQWILTTERSRVKALSKELIALAEEYNLYLKYTIDPMTKDRVIVVLPEGERLPVDKFSI